MSPKKTQENKILLDNYMINSEKKILYVLVVFLNMIHLKTSGILLEK